MTRRWFYPWQSALCNSDDAALEAAGELVDTLINSFLVDPETANSIALHELEHYLSDPEGLGCFGIKVELANPVGGLMPYYSPQGELSTGRIRACLQVTELSSGDRAMRENFRMRV